MSRRADLADALRRAGVEVGSVNGQAFREVVADRLLASDWLQSILAAEREHIAQAIEARRDEFWACFKADTPGNSPWTAMNEAATIARNSP